jgi:gliding motility-associated-like protein
MIRHLGLFVLSLLLSILAFELQATHIRAGEIIVTRIPGPGFTYRITVIGYTDTRSPVPFGAGTLRFGDGREVRLDDAARQPGNSFIRTDLGNAVASNVVEIIHTFQGPGLYTVSYEEDFRNAGVLNMNNSVNTAFYIETQFLIDPLLPNINTPVLLVPPVDRGCVGIRFIHNPGAFDADGDSIAYVLIEPKQTRNRTVDGYVPPNHPRFGGSNQAGNGAPTFTLDPVTGDLIWDSPGQAGEYNVAFIVEKWRKINDQYIRVAYVTRDLQILIVADCRNRPPDIEIPQDICVVAGTNISEAIVGTDPDNDPVLLEAFGGVFDLPRSPASFSPALPSFRPSPATSLFDWQTDCSHVRERPYQVQFKVTDNPQQGPRLVNIRTWNIRVIAPAPELRSATLRPGRLVDLEWEPYECGNFAANIQIWRRMGSNPYLPDTCETGIREGYQLISELPINATSFRDNSISDTQISSSQYCYRIIATFPQPAGGSSIVSREVCVEILVDRPLMTNVDVRETSTNNGQIFLRWTSPFQIDREQFLPPYRYDVYRFQGFEGGVRTFIGSTQDTLFLDAGLDTENNPYRYRVQLWTADNQLVDSSATASSVKLTANARINVIDLTWQYNVPWDNASSAFPKHYIYRNRVNPANLDAFVLIDSVNVTSGTLLYTDSGGGGTREFSTDQVYCYYVSTQGVYDIAGIPRPLINNSQIVCQSPRDIDAPCAPILTLTTPDCDSFFEGRECGYRGDDFFNSFRWTPVINDDGCDDDIEFFNIYFSESGSEGEFVKIASVPRSQSEFIHERLSSLEGCYMVTAVDGSGNESPFSNVICNQNCPQYELPNVFTPNGDGFNDTWRAVGNPLSACPRFVASVRIKIYNRWEAEVFSYESNTQEGIFINWNGTDSKGNELPAGTYYYYGEVVFITNNAEQRRRELKGWVQLKR